MTMSNNQMVAIENYQLSKAMFYGSRMLLTYS